MDSVKVSDMEEFAALPFAFDREIKYSGPGSLNPWYMDLSPHNILVAKDQVSQLNDLVQSAWKASKAVPLDLCIPETRLVFSPQKRGGCTRIYCTPYTQTGKKSKFPCSLVFLTEYDPGNETSGEIWYAQDGSMGKARVTIWRDHVMYSLLYKTVGRSFVLGEVKTNSGLNPGEVPVTIYKA